MKTAKSALLLSLVFFLGLLGQQNLSAQETKAVTNLKELHTEQKAVQTKVIFTAEDGKVVSLKIAKGEELKDHVSNLSALFLCVTGDATYEDVNGKSIRLKAGDYMFIEKDVMHKVTAKKDSNFILIR
ncbi:cupin domain-containing protein [Roseivirga sp.]|uniref:cupin domain-containing protein n=1 Tax=Roseivirga sp. TaxID=1964215 RepID=UPI002B267919|nr:cupin domain-containing protein [Roseivirga sp.]